MSTFKVKQINSISEWEDFAKNQDYTLFVQSAHYGDFYRATGENFWIFGVYDGNELIAGSLVVSVHAKRGNFLYLPYGPLISKENKNKEAEILELLCLYLKEFAKKENFDFVRLSPFEDDSEERKKIYKKIGFFNAPMHILAETTWILDISGTEEQVLSGMKKNHRNLIRRCERDGVKVTMTDSGTKLESLHKLLDITADRHKFVRFSRDYIDKEFKAFSPHKEAVLFEAFLPDGRLDSASVIMFYGSMAAYRHSGSLGLDPKLPTSYALQWAVIKEAKRRNIKLYNFWGIAPDESNKSHPFYGITHFKKGFGGEKKQLLHCHDLPVKSSYWLNWIIETARRIRRGF